LAAAEVEILTITVLVRPVRGDQGADQLIMLLPAAEPLIKDMPAALPLIVKDMQLPAAAAPDRQAEIVQEVAPAVPAELEELAFQTHLPAQVYIMQAAVVAVVMTSKLPELVVTAAAVAAEINTLHQAMVPTIPEVVEVVLATLHPVLRVEQEGLVL
jgi:hypothetical protein